MTAKQWALLGVVQAAAIALLAVSNIHTNVLPLIVGYLLLAPGIFISSKVQAGVQSRTPQLQVSSMPCSGTWSSKEAGQGGSVGGDLAVKPTKRAVGPGDELSPTSPIDRWRVEPLEGIFIVRLKVGRADQTERWQITGREAVYATADEALAALHREVDEDETDA